MAGAINRTIADFNRVNSTTYKLWFWILTYLLYDSTLLALIRDETSHAFTTTGELSMTFLLDSCVRLNRLFDEVLRMTNSSSSVRSVVSDTVIGDFVLRPGAKVLIPYLQLHFDEATFGANAQEFDSERFFKQKNLHKSPGYRPFGGGSTYFPGRLIARQEVVAFVAYVMKRFELEVSNAERDCTPNTFPRLEENKPCLGVMRPVHGNDLIVSIRRRMSA